MNAITRNKALLYGGAIVAAVLVAFAPKVIDTFNIMQLTVFVSA